MQETVNVCEAELARRRVLHTKRSSSHKQTHVGETVHGFHFVCPTEKGVTKNRDGTVWTGIWVVDKNHAERAVKIGGYLAVHVTKSKRSYLQDIVRDWRVRERELTYSEGQPVKTKFGIDFLIELTDEPFEWQGDGAGEKGYFYGEHSGSHACNS